MSSTTIKGNARNSPTARDQRPDRQPAPREPDGQRAECPRGARFGGRDQPEGQAADHEAEQEQRLQHARVRR